MKQFTKIVETKIIYDTGEEENNTIKFKKSLIKIMKVKKVVDFIKVIWYIILRERRF